jgi:protein TonB
MFEQALVEAQTKDKKRYTVLLSLLLQVGVLAVLIAAPLIYTRVLPRAQLRSVFAAPTPPPPPTLPKAPATVRMTLARPSFQMSTAVPIVSPPQSDVRELAAPAIVAEANTVGDPYSTGDPVNLAPVKPPDPPAPIAKPATKPLRIASMQASQLIFKVQPAYPPIAKVTRIQGVVEFTATISKTGVIEHLQLVRGHPMLVKAAEEAILQWKYKPTLLNGEPVEVITDIIVNFTLTQ